MEREDPQPSDQDVPLTSQVLEYYKKYSQNRELPKYFSGSSFKISDWCEGQARPVEADSATVAVNTDEDTFYSPDRCWSRPPIEGDDYLCEQPKPPDINVVASSPTSSVASNRKLEWDSGADIGYTNAESQKTLHKSFSLPILSSLEYEPPTKIERINPEGQGSIEKPRSSKKSSDSSSLGDLAGSKQYSSSSGSYKSEPEHYIPSSTSSDVPPPSSRFISDSETSSEIQNEEMKVVKKAGAPLAESTPVLDQARVSKTSVSKNVHKNSESHIGIKATIVLKDINLKEKLSRSFREASIAKLPSTTKLESISTSDKSSKVKNFCISKPVLVECIGPVPSGENKIIQTTLPRNASVALQTDFDFTDCKEVPITSTPYIERQGLIFLYHSDSERERNSHSSATQTNSDALSKCNSFEYLYAADYNQQLADQEQQDEKSPSEEVERILLPNEAPAIVGQLKRCPPKSDLTLVSLSSESSSLASSTNTPLTKLVSLKSSESVPDLQQNLRLLKMVLKSGKYDSATKKCCIKKVMKRMMDSKYVDDILSESSDHSKQDQISSSSSKQSLQEQNDKLSLHDNKPWKPIQQDEPEVEPVRLIAETFSEEIAGDSKPQFPNQESPGAGGFVPIIHARSPRLQRNALLTLTDGDVMAAEKEVEDPHDHGDDRSTSNDLYEALDTPSSVPSSTSNESKEEVKKKSWREDLTKSEKLLAEKRDHLVSFAKQERKQQLYWINNEITHLNKLKQLLERNSESKKILRSMVEKPHVEDMKGRGTSATVYVVTTERSDECLKKKDCGRFLDPTPSSSQQPDYQRMPRKEPICTCGLVGAATESELNLMPQSPPDANTVVDVGSAMIEVKNAKLLSEQQFNTCSSCGKTCIRRYAFEIPDPTCSLRPVIRIRQGAADDAPCKNYVIRNEHVVASAQTSTFSTRDQPAQLDRDEDAVSLRSRGTSPGPRIYEESASQTSKTSTIRSSYSQTKPKVQPVCSRSTSPTRTSASAGSQQKIQTVISRSTSPIPVVASGSRQSRPRSCTSRATSPMPTSVSATGSGRSRARTSVPVSTSGSSRPRSPISKEQCVSSRATSPALRSFSSVATPPEVPKTISEGTNDNLLETKDAWCATSSYVCAKGDTPSFAKPCIRCAAKPVTAVNISKKNEGTGPRRGHRSTQISEENQFVAATCVYDSIDVASQPTRVCTCKNYQDVGTAPRTTLVCIKEEAGAVCACCECFKEVEEPTCSCDCSTSTVSLTKSHCNRCTSTTDMETKPSTCECKHTQTKDTRKVCMKVCSSSDSELSECSEPQVCRCCKKKHKYVMRLQPKEEPLCQPCYKQNTVVPYYTYPGHNCTCYTALHTNAMQKMRSTIDKLQSLESDEYCMCTESDSHSEFDSCVRCRKRLKHKFKKNKGGMAYALVLESGDRKKHKKGKNTPVIEEIGVKMVSPCESNTQTQYTHTSSGTNKDATSKTKKDQENKAIEEAKLTVQEYLFENRPNFIAAAEERRKCLLDLAVSREQRFEKYKQLLALSTAPAPSTSKPHLYTDAQMRKITNKRYKRLPEIQQKKLDRKEKLIKKANRIITDVFNEKLRQQVLKGQLTLPTDASVINLLA